MGNDMNAMMTLFTEAFAGLAGEHAQRHRGQAYRDVLIDALQADDNDGDITNGTPNGNEIVEAFAIHGITPISNAELDHTPIEATVENQGHGHQRRPPTHVPFTTYRARW